ncbi:DUF6797 domain-containing protein [Tautonia marina]|uniref:DUF6797 domain-containing protein n=1 Tax=Tautonia marina TaxID=2653855 RepID=UPI0012606BE2|nr:cytochrome c [Tautonia marina]
MPTGLVNLMADRQQFLDLASYLIEAAEFGPARARSLRPDPSVINPPLPAYEADLDHAGLIAALDDDAFRRGALLYARNCASCHGTREQPGSMPTSLQFAEGQFRNGKAYGPLSRSWGRYRGRYDAGDRTILSYTVGNAEVLESTSLSDTTDRSSSGRSRSARETPR